MLRLYRIAAYLLVLIALGSASDVSPETDHSLVVGQFSAEAPGLSIPDKWEPLAFEDIDRHTEYRLVRDENTVVLRAQSEASASGLIREISIDPAEYPFVEWRWKVASVLRKGDVTTEKRDDSAARLYIGFAYDRKKVGFFEKLKFMILRMIYGRYPPSGAINYIWASRVPVGDVLPNRHTRRVTMFVLESGSEKVNAWISERRNIYDDYQRAFGKDPPLISGVGVMTDTDNTGESATAYYGDIVFKSE